MYTSLSMRYINLSLWNLLYVDVIQNLRYIRFNKPFSSIKYIYFFLFRLGIAYVNQNYCDHSLGDEIPWDVLVRIRLFMPLKGNCIMQWYFLDQRYVNLLFGAGIGSYYKGLKFSIEVLFINSTFLSCTHILPERNRFYISNKIISTESDFIVILFFDSFYILWVTSNVFFNMLHTDDQSNWKVLMSLSLSFCLEKYVSRMFFSLLIKG